MREDWRPVKTGKAWRSAGGGHTDWRLDAACRYLDPELFFPVGTAGPAVQQIDQAKQVCHACPVREQCLGWALAHDPTLGIWGGTTEDQRRALRLVASRR
jgi:WhiB family redox-sensing transcriptional regulator